MSDDEPANVAAGRLASTAPGALQRPQKRSSSPHTERAFKSQRSVSEEIGPGLRQTYRLQSNPNSGGGSGNGGGNFEDETLEETGDFWAEQTSCAPGGDDNVVGGDALLGPGGSLAQTWSSKENCECCDFPLQQQQPESAGVDQVDGLGFISDLINMGKQKVCRFGKKLAERFRMVLPESSLEKNPHNNVHVPHPAEKMFGRMVGLGMFIQKNNRGHLVHTVIPEGLAAKSKLQNNDVIISVNDHDVTSWEFEMLQKFFGSLEEVEFQIVVEREEQDESGETVLKKITITIRLSTEDDQVIVDIEIKYGQPGWHYDGETGPLYIYQNADGESTKYLTYKGDSFCMAIGSDLTACRFKTLNYSGVYNPKVFINISSNLPVDHGTSTRIGVQSQDLFGQHLDILHDSRVFFFLVQESSQKYVFQLASKTNHYLTVDSMGKLATTYFPNRASVQPSGLFGKAKTSDVDKLSPSQRQKFDGKDKISSFGGGKSFGGGTNFGS